MDVFPEMQRGPTGTSLRTTGQQGGHQKHNGMSPQPVRTAMIETKTGVGEDVENPCTLWDCKLVLPLKWHEVSLKFKNRTALRLSDSSSGYLSDVNKNTALKRCMRPHPLLTAALFTSAKTRKQPTCAPKDEGVQKVSPPVSLSLTHTHTQRITSHKHE